MSDTAWPSRNEHFRHSDSPADNGETTGSGDTRALVMDERATPTSDGQERTNQSDRDDLLQLKPGEIEERFRVDRRKLEQLLQAADSGSGETGEEFFSNVERQSGAHVSWPSKLKIGAKSKKDPHVKVRGFPHQVTHAKRLIMARLDTKSNRVTLKMDVAHTEHSHVIGKGGANIQRVMADTGCHIHFPDCNSSVGGRGYAQGEKSDQVSLTGQPHGVEVARRQVRDLLPLTLAFDLPLRGNPPDSNSAEVRDLAQKHGVLISFRSRPRMQVVTCLVRGSQRQEQNVQQCTSDLARQLTGSGNVTVTISVDIASHHHQAMMGRGGANIKQVMQSSGATVEFPNTSASAQRPRSLILISGSVEAACVARQLLLGWLPLVLMFEMPGDESQAMADASEVMEATDVFITIKPRPKQTSKSVIIKSIERNVANVYRARLLLLNQETFCDEPGSDFGTAQRHVNSTASNDQSSMALSGLHENSVVGSHFHMPFKPSFVQPPLPTTFAPGGGESSLTLLPRQQWQSSSQEHIPHEERPLAPPPGIHTPPRRPETYTSHSPLKQQEDRSTMSAISSGMENLSFMQKTTTDDGHGFFDLPTRRQSGHSPSASGGSVELAAMSHAVSPGPADSLASRLNASLNDYASDGYSHDRLAGLLQSGNEQHARRSLFSDYEDKRRKAHRAMSQGRRDMSGGVRVPTDEWSGFGLSKSTPEHILREQLQQQQQRFSPTMPSVNESDFSCSPQSQAMEQPWSTLGSDHHRRSVTHPTGIPVDDGFLPFRSQTSSRHLDVKLWRSLNGHRHATPGLANVQDLGELLAMLDLSKYSTLFDEQEVDLPTFLTLNEADLKDLGIATFGARRRMMLAIEELQLVQQPHAWRRGVMAQLIPPSTSSGGSVSDFSSDGSGGGSAGGSSLLQALMHAQPNSQVYDSPRQQQSLSRNGQW